MGREIVAGAVAATTTRSGGSSVTFLVVALVIIGFLYFVMLRPQRQRQRRIMETQRQIVPGMRVRTTSGMYGTVTSTDDQDITLEVAPGVEIRFMRRAIMGVVQDGSETGFTGTPPAQSASPDGSAPSGDSPAKGETGTGSEEDERSAP